MLRPPGIHTSLKLLMIHLNNAGKMNFELNLKQGSLDALNLLARL